MTGDKSYDWNNDYSVGHLGLDGEHRYFVELVNRLSYMMASSAPRHEILEILLILESETEVHFQHEEDILKLTGYPTVRDHAERHRQLLEAVIRTRHAIENRADVDLKAEAGRVGDLQRLLFEHILSEDRSFRDHIK